MMTIDPEFLREMLANPNGSHGSDSNDAIKRIKAIGIPKTMGDDGTGKIRNGRSKREESTAIFAVPRRYLRK